MRGLPLNVKASSLVETAQLGFDALVIFFIFLAVFINS